MKNIFKKIVELSDSRMNELEQWLQENNTVLKNFYTWPETYAQGVIWEMQEAIDEIKQNNSVYLEDELGDVFWTYISLMKSLEKQWYIESVENVFNRCDKKFGERIWYVRENTYEWAWEEIKKKQKIERKNEHEEKYWK